MNLETTPWADNEKYPDRTVVLDPNGVDVASVPIYRHQDKRGFEIPSMIRKTNRDSSERVNVLS